MSYQINFRSRDIPAINVTTERGEKIKDLWFDGKKDTPIDIDGDAYLVGDIKAIFQIPNPITYAPNFDSPVLPSGSVCKGQYSIQKDINQIIKDEGQGWAKNIQDKTYRDKIRLQLRTLPGVKWCDHYAGECACE